MKVKESMQEILYKVFGTISHMKNTVKVSAMKLFQAEKLTKNCDCIDVVIEESKDLSTYTFDELMIPLQPMKLALETPKEHVR